MEENDRYSRIKSLETIRRVFGQLPLPNPDDIDSGLESEIFSTDRWLAKYFNLVEWWHVDPAAYHYIDFGLQFTPAGFRYYFPGLLSLAIREEHVQHTIDVLDSLGSGRKLSTWYQPRLICILGLSREELQTVIDSLHSLARIWIEKDYCNIARQCISTRRNLRQFLQGKPFS